LVKIPNLTSISLKLNDRLLRKRKKKSFSFN
jgi:hypothetical protein